MVYIDKDFKCHATNSDNLFRGVDTDFFDGKCEAFIEGYRYIPPGESWTRSDGIVFAGEMMTPWKSYPELVAAQRQYEKQLFTEYEEALKIVGVVV